jgi:hypothetical protein
MANFRGVGAIDAMADFGHRYGGQDDARLPDEILDTFDRLSGGQLASLGSDKHAAVEHQSQDAGFHGWR